MSTTPLTISPFSVGDLVKVKGSTVVRIIVRIDAEHPGKYGDHLLSAPTETGKGKGAWSTADRLILVKAAKA